jgi:hypothetical protein
MFMLLRLLFAGLIFSSGSVLALAQEPTRITSVSNVRLRASPSETAAVVASLPLGAELVQLESGGDGASWTRVRVTAGGSHDGWLPTRLTRSLVTSRRADVIEEIVKERLARKGDGFGARAELADFVGRELKRTPDPETGGRFALYWMRAMSAALEAVPFGRGSQPPYKSWLAGLAGTVVYDEPGGRWMIRADRLRALHDEYARTSSADEIAWAAVQHGLPGACEGFIPCYVRRLNLLEGEYLRRSALGTHVDEAVARVAHATSQWPWPPARPYFLDPARDCAELVTSLDPLRAAVAATRADGVQSVLGRLDKLRSGCAAEF